jgi:DNA modification methylase
MPESVRDRPTSCHEKIWLITKNKKYYYDADAIKEPCKSQVSEKIKIRFGGNKYGDSKDKHHQTKSGNNYIDTGLKNKRNVWTVTTKPFKDAHFATFPKDLIEPCIKAGCPEKVCVKCGKPQIKEFYRDKSTLPVKRNKRDGDGDRAVGGVYQKWLEENPPQITIKPSCDCNADFKPGVVLDPFGGSGTTGIVAALNNRNAILIELNQNYIDIANKRIEKEVGLFI